MGKRIGFLATAIIVLGICISAWGQGVYEAWVARYNGPYNGGDAPQALAVDDSGNVYVAGYSKGSGADDFDYVTIKYSPSGESLWTARYDGPGHFWDWAYDLAIDDSGNVYVTGYSHATGTSGSEDYATIKYDRNGSILWVRRFNGTGNGDDAAHHIVLDKLGNIVVTGVSFGSGSYNGCCTIKYAPNGDSLWVRYYFGQSNLWAQPYDLVIDQYNNVYIAGQSYKGTSYDCFVVKYDSGGDTVWTRTYSSPAGPYRDAVAYGIAVDKDGNVYVTGSVKDSSNFADYVTIKYSSSGEQLWVRRYDGPSNGSDEATGIILDVSGNVYITGSSCGSGTYPYCPDYATIKYSPNGDSIWVRRYNGPGNGEDRPSGMATDESGNIYVTGFCTVIAPSGPSDIATIKYSSIGDSLWVKHSDGRSRGIAVGKPRNIYVISPGGDDFVTIRYYEDERPILDSIGPKSVGEGNSLSFNLHAIDPDLDTIILANIPTLPNATLTDSGNGSGVFNFTPDTTQEGVYSLYFIASDTFLADTSTVEITVTRCEAIPGDANKDGNLTLSDIISAVNLIFNKTGCAPAPMCWVYNLLCRGDWNGDTIVSLSDVIRGVNYIFNKPGGPWNPVPSGACCLPVP